MATAAAVGLADSLYNYLVLGSGIDHTAGALLVVCSTALLLVAAVVLAVLRRGPAVLKGLLGAAAFLDLIGTGVAAWFLHAWVLLALMVVGLIAWIGWLAGRAAGGDRLGREAYP